MPSFLGRFIGISFRTERLIMNIIGLINSTFDWSPLKWTNELEQIQNITLSYSTLILSSVGEDTIKSVLSWIVIARIVIAHVYTFSYLTNMYPILTWSRPNLLLPWLILSFFKNVVLEMIVLAVCILYWYDKRFSLVIFLEFLLLKIVPLILATYNWYSNSCLFLKLRYAEKLMKSKRILKSETNFVTTRLCMKMSDSKYRTRSLTTLLSYESYETFDTHDTISRILEDSDLTPAQKTTKILGLTQQEILDARARRNEREVHRRLTEVDDDLFQRKRSIPKSFFMFEDDYEEQLQSLLKQDENVPKASVTIQKTPSPLENSKETTVETPPEVEEKPVEETILDDPVEINAPKSSNKRKEENTLQKEQCSSCSKNFEANNSLTQNRDCTWLEKTKSKEKDEDNSSLIKLQSAFNCDCLMDDNLFKDMKERCCLPDKVTLKTSTPNGSPDTGRTKANLESNDLNESEHSCSYDCNVNENNGAPLTEDLLKSDVKILENIAEDSCLEKLVQEEKLPEELKSVKHDSCTKTLVMEENFKQKVRQMAEEINILLTNFQNDPYLRELTIEESVEQTGNQNVSIGVPSLSEIVKDMKTASPVETFEMLTTTDFDEDIHSTSYKSEVKGNRLKLNAPEYSFGDTNIPRFYKNSMKVFDGCYEKDFANNSELQCVLQQLEKKKWNPFAGQSNLETMLQQTDEINQSTVQDLGNVSPPVKDCEKTDRLKISSKLQTFTSVIPIKNSDTQTDSANPPSKHNFDAKHWKKMSLKRKRLKDQSSFSSINDHHDGEIKSRHVSSSPKHAKQPNDQKRPNLSKSSSDRSMCECKMQQLEAKCSPSSDSKKDRRKSSPKVDSFGTVTLAQVTRHSEFNAFANRRKPPIYPKKIKGEISQNSLPKITPMIKKLQESKRSKIKNRVESLDDKEMRALKAYNEVTLLKDKKQLDAKRKVSSNKTTLDILPKESKHRIRPRKSNSKKKLNQDSKLITEEYLDKENLSAGVSVGLKSSSTAMSSKASHERYTCEKLSKVNRVTDKILDRLFAIQKQNQRKSRLTETDTRKQFTKYSKPKQMIDEEVVSASSSKRLEGMQKGRDLERTPAKEDIRRTFTDTVDLSRMQPLLEDTEHPKTEQDRLLLTIKSSVNQGVASSWSLSTTELEEAQLEEALPTMDQPVTTVISEEITKKEAIVQQEVSPLKPLENESVLEENSVNMSEVQIDDGPRRRSNYTDFTRNINVSHLPHGVVLSNPNAPANKNPRQRGIVDDTTSRLLHNAFSYHSMDSIIDFNEDDLNVNDFANERHLNTLDEGFVCHASTDAVNVFADINLEDAIPNILRESQNLEQENNCDFLVATIDDEDLMSEGINSNNVFSVVDQFLRNLNIRDFISEDIDESRTLQDISEDYENATEENEVIEEEDETSEEDRTLRFIKEDVFTDIKFPVVINWSDFLIASNEDPEETNLTIRDTDAEIRPVGLLSLSGPKDEKNLEEDAKLRSEETKNIVEQTVFFVKQEFSSEVEKLEHERRNVYSTQRSEKIEDDCFKSKYISSDDPAFRTYQIMKYFESEDSLSDTDSEKDEKRIEKCTELEKIENNDRDSLESKEEEEIIVIEEKVMSRNIEEIVKGFQSININDNMDETILLEESMELEEIEIPDRYTRSSDPINEEHGMILIEESVELDETNEFQSITDVQDVQDDEGQQEIREIKDAVSTLTIILFWIITFYFYVEFWWQKIFSVRNSTSTLSLNPFQIRTVPMSAMNLLEKIEEEEEKDKDDLLEEERKQDFTIRKQHSRMDLTIDQISSGIIEFESDSEETEKDVEEAMLFLSEHISENVDIPSFSNSDEEKTRLNLSSSEIFQEEDEPRDLRAAEEEIRTLRFEIVDDSSSTKSFFEHDEETKLFVDDQLNDPRTEEKIGEDGPLKEEIPTNEDTKEEEETEERFLKGEPIGEEKIEEAEGSTEKTKVLEPNLQITDSFDSTYSIISSTSKRTISDLNASSMEEFDDGLDN